MQGIERIEVVVEEPGGNLGMIHLLKKVFLLQQHSRDLCDDRIVGSVSDLAIAFWWVLGQNGPGIRSLPGVYPGIQQAGMGRLRVATDQNQRQKRKTKT